MKGLDLSKFKKTCSDKNCTTLRHPDGHEIKVAHSGLSSKMRADLEKLPIHKADGGDTEEPAPDDQQNDHATANPEPAPPQPPVNININSGASPTPVPTALPPPAQESPQATGVPGKSETQTLAPEPMPAKTPVADVAAQPAPQAQAQTATEQLPQQETQPAAPITPEQHMQATKQDLTQEAQAWQNDLQNGHIKPETYHDLFAKKDTLGKVGTLFGLLISGMGAGLTHQPNAVMEMMNREIGNDLEAQKQSKDNAMNFLRVNQQHQMNEAQIKHIGVENQSAMMDTKIKANALARMQMNIAAFHNLSQNVQRLPPGSPQRQQAENTLAMMYQSMNNENSMVTDRAAAASALANFANGNSSASNPEQGFQQQNTMLRMSGNEKLAADKENKHIPGISGKASHDLSDADREGINSGIEFDQKLHRFIDWTKSHSGDLSPEDMNEGRALSAELQGAYRQATHGGVYKEGEQNFISKLIDSDPTKFFNGIRVLPQLNAIAGENQKRVNQLVKSKGLPGYPGIQESSPKQSTPTVPKEGDMITNKSTGEKRIMQNGRWQKVK